MTKEQIDSFAGGLTIIGIIIISLALGAWHWWIGVCFFGICLLTLGLLISVFGHE